MINDKVSISLLSLAELLPAAKKKSKKTLNALEEFLDEVDKLPVTENIARIASDVKYKLDRKGKEKMLFDIIIAVTANNNHLKLISLDTDFEVIGEVLDYNYEIME